jgi:hypothetical protein
MEPPTYCSTWDRGQQIDGSPCNVHKNAYIFLIVAVQNIGLPYCFTALGHETFDHSAMIYPTKPVFLSSGEIFHSCLLLGQYHEKRGLLLNASRLSWLYCIGLLGVPPRWYGNQKAHVQLCETATSALEWSVLIHVCRGASASERCGPAAGTHTSCLVLFRSTSVVYTHDACKGLTGKAIDQSH